MFCELHKQYRNDKGMVRRHIYVDYFRKYMTPRSFGAKEDS